LPWEKENINKNKICQNVCKGVFAGLMLLVLPAVRWTAAEFLHWVSERVSSISTEHKVIHHRRPQ